MEFQQKYEALYGKHAVTPNIHLHRHIERCIIDYVHFWLFAFAWKLSCKPKRAWKFN